MDTMNRRLAIAPILGLILATFAAPAEASRRHPPKPPRPPRPVHVVEVVPRTIASDLCATNPRAEADAHRQLTAAVTEWLADSGVDRTWTPPKKLIDRMILGAPTFEPVQVKELSVVRATVTADFSDHRKREFLDVYRRHTGGRRLAVLGGGLAVVLAGLAAVSGFIRADEATKGYYTTRLRLAATVGVGVAGVVAYRILS